MRQFNVFSEQVVVHPSEQFQWVVNQAEIPSGDSQVTVQGSGSSWPLNQTSYNVTPSAPVPATVNSNAARAQATFQCTPPAQEVTAQSIIVACAAPFDVCDEVNVQPGDHFFWKNTTGQDVTIAPDPENEEFWPLPQQQYVVPAGDILHLQIPDNATPTGSNPCNLTVTCPSGPVCGDRMTGQPKIIVGSSQGQATAAFQSRAMVGSSQSGEPLMGQPKIIVE